MAANRILVPLSDTVTVRQTVAYAIQSALESADEAIECHLVVAIPYDADVPEGQQQITAATELLSRAKSWVEEDIGSAGVTIETAVLGTDTYLFGPKDYADQLSTYAAEHDVERVVLDPEYRPGVTGSMIQPLERELDRVGLAYDEAPIERPARHERLVGEATESFDKYVALFVVSFGFYLILGDPTYWFDLVTGVAVAGIVSYSLAHVTFTFPLNRVQSPLRIARFTFYVPYLVFEIVKANLAISLVILRPSMPIDPTMTRVNARVRSGLPLLALANSITLTPGTLTVRANDQRLIVHTLIPSAREDLFDGSLERAIRFVFHGRVTAAVATPRERGDTEIIRNSEAGDTEIVGGDEL